MSASPRPEPFRIAVADEALDDLRRRLAATRWPEPIGPDDWSRRHADRRRAGARRLLARRLRLARAGAPPERPARSSACELDDYEIHFIHVRGRGPDPLPLLLTNGWPSSIHEYAKVIGPAHRPRRARWRPRRRVRRGDPRAARLSILAGAEPRRHLAGGARAVATPDDGRARLPALRRVGRRPRCDRDGRSRRVARRRRRGDPARGRVRRHWSRRADARRRRARVPEAAHRVGARGGRLLAPARHAAADALVRAQRLTGRACWRGSSRSTVPGRTAAATCTGRSPATSCSSHPRSTGRRTASARRSGRTPTPARS